MPLSPKQNLSQRKDKHSLAMQKVHVFSKYINIHEISIKANYKTTGMKGLNKIYHKEQNYN